MLHTAGDLARKRKEKGLKLNYVETIAYITAELYESAREGKNGGIFNGGGQTLANPQ